LVDAADDGDAGTSGVHDPPMVTLVFDSMLSPGGEVGFTFDLCESRDPNNLQNETSSCPNGALATPSDLAGVTTISADAVPEPAAIGVVGVGLLLIALARRRAALAAS
jgi:hypothetical protein